MTLPNEVERILKNGSTVEIKLVAGEIQIIEIKRKLKIKIPLETGQAEGQQGPII